MLVSNSCDDGLGCNSDLKCVLADGPTSAPGDGTPPPVSHISWILGLILFFVWRSRLG
jgi:hypothetical protein